MEIVRRLPVNLQLPEQEAKPTGPFYVDYAGRMRFLAWPNLELSHCAEPPARVECSGQHAVRGCGRRRPKSTVAAAVEDVCCLDGRDAAMTMASFVIATAT